MRALVPATRSNARVLVLLALLPLAAAARPVPLEAGGLDRASFARFDDPVLVDRRALGADLKRLGAMLDELAAKRGPKVRARVEAIRARLDAIEHDLRSARQVRHRRWAVPDIPDTPEPVPPAPTAASGAEMTRLLNSLRAASFRDDKLRVLREAAAGLRFRTAQTIQLVRTLNFGGDKVEAFVVLYPRLVDPENFHTAYQALAHDSDRRALEKRVAPLRGK